jgi:hypothetical protein
MATINLGSIKFKWKGTYNGATAYTVDDVVEYNGSSYICILASTGNLPTDTTYFEQMSQAGTNGTDGTDLTSTLTTQGDIVYRDGSGLARLGAGTSGQVLQTNGTGANPSWGDAGGGKILQVVEGSLTTSFASTSSTFVATGLNVSITPSATSSKVFVQVGAYADHNGSAVQSYFTIYRDSSNLGTPNGGIISNYSASSRLRGSVSMSVLDSPNTTSAINYEVYMQNQSGGNLQLNSEASNVRIIAMEVGA